jgi:hypothetical protein
MNTLFRLEDKAANYYMEIINVVAGAGGEPPPPINYLLYNTGSQIELNTGGFLEANT